MARVDEAARLAALRGYGVLDTAPEAAFDRLTALAADLFDAPIALVTLIDAERQWHKSAFGIERGETSREEAFCNHLIPRGPGATMVVEDATADLRFAGNPFVTGDPDVRFYAGAALTTAEGHNLGALCVIDRTPRAGPDAKTLARLQTLAGIVVDELELRKASRALAERQQQLDLAEEIAGIGHWRMDLAAGSLTWSPGAYRIYGLDPAQPIDFAASARMLHPDDRLQSRLDAERAMATGQGYASRTRITRPDGQERITDGRTVCELGPDGRVAALFGVRIDVTEQVRAEAAMQAAREAAEEHARRADQAEAVAGLGHWRLDADTGALEWSPQMYAIYGLDPGKTLDLTTLLAMSHEEDRQLGSMRIMHMLEGGGVSDSLSRIHRADGGLRWLRGRMTAERGPDGRVLALLGTVMDVTEQHEAEAALADSEARYRTLADNTSDILIRFGRDGIIKYISPACRTLGVDPETAVGQSVVTLVAPDHIERSAEIVAALFTGAEVDGGVRRLHRIIDNTGREVWLEGSPKLVRDESGDVAEVVTVLRDVTARQRMEQALADSEGRYRVVTDAVRDVILQYDLDGTIRYASGAARQLGYDPKALVGLNCADLMHPMDVPAAAAQLAALHDRAAADGPGEPAEHRIRAADGSYVWIEGNPTLLRDVRGKAFAYVNTLRDITARKAMEEALKAARAEAEAAAAVKGEFLANMSHELRTPLTSVLGFTRLALEQGDLSDATRGYISRAAGAGSALLTTVNDILDFSKLEAGQVEIRPRPADAADVAQECLDLFSQTAAEKGLTLRLAVDGAVPSSLDFDPDRVRQLLINLVGNAVKFSEAGEVVLSVGWADGRLSMAVADQGPGLAPEDQERLFRRFSQVDGSTTRRHGGTGLGLAICKGLTEAMGGAIGVDSAPGRGARFHFTLPAPVSAAAETVGVFQVTHGTRVLAVDDHPVNLALVRAILTPFGCEVTEADDGESAVALAGELPFDIILMDLRMPGLDGLAAVRAIRQGGGLNAATPILALSGDADAEGAPARLAAGFDGDLMKPVTPGSLAAAVARHTSWETYDAEYDAA